MDLGPSTVARFQWRARYSNPVLHLAGECLRLSNLRIRRVLGWMCQSEALGQGGHKVRISKGMRLNPLASVQIVLIGISRG
jgi:hypothetical protein